MIPTPTDLLLFLFSFFFFNDTATTEIYTLSLHDALPIYVVGADHVGMRHPPRQPQLATEPRSEEHTSELQSQFHLVCRLLLEKKKKLQNTQYKTLPEQTSPAVVLKPRTHRHYPAVIMNSV